MKISALIKGRCPSCKTGPVFSGLFKMQIACPHCHFVYEREEGYFTGAMIVGNILASVVLAPVVLLLGNSDMSMAMVLLSVFALCLLLLPFFFRASRLIWIYFDYVFLRDV